MDESGSLRFTGLLIDIFMDKRLSLFYSDNCCFCQRPGNRERNPFFQLPPGCLRLFHLNLPPTAEGLLSNIGRFSYSTFLSLIYFSQSTLSKSKPERKASLSGSISLRAKAVESARQQGSIYVRKRLNKSMGTGRTTLELLSADTSTRLCKNLRCRAVGCFAMTSAASANFCEA